MKSSVRVGLWVVALAVTQLFLFNGDMALAQRGQRGGGGGGGRGFRGGATISKFDIIQNETVQKDLDLKEETVSKLEEMAEKIREEQREIMEENRGNFQAVGEAIGKVNDKAAGELKDLLDDKQTKRLDGIFIQINGPTVLTDKTVASMLKVSDDQTKKLEAFIKVYQEKMGELFGEVSRDELMEKMTELREEQDKELMAVLTKEQTKAFEDAKGEALDIDRRDLRRRGGGAGRQRGQGGQGGGQGGRGRRGGQRSGDNQDF